MRYPDEIHERFTVDYIQREAGLLVHFLGYGKRGGFGRTQWKLTPRDKRILQRWGILR